MLAQELLDSAFLDDKRILSTPFHPPMSPRGGEAAAAAHPRADPAERHARDRLMNLRRVTDRRPVDG
jgi:hypothetical protein